MLLLITLDVYHGASSYMYGVLVLPVTTSVPWTIYIHPRAAQPTPETSVAHTIVWRANFPAEILASLVLWMKPKVRVTNSNLELVG